MGYSWDGLTESWLLTLRGAALSEKTIRGYTLTLTYFRRWLDVEYPGIDPGDVGKTHVTGWMAHMLTPEEGSDRARLSKVTVSNRYRDLQQWCRFLVEDAEVHEISPMATMRPPKVDRPVVPTIQPDDLLRVIRICAGKDFYGRRDMAILLMLTDTGVRREECSRVDVSDVNLSTQRVLIHGKGGKERLIPVGVATALAIDKYKRERSKQPGSSNPALWISRRGDRLTPEGIHQMLKRRGRDAGVPSIRAHRFRHTMAHTWLANGGNVIDLMAIAGWETDQMVRRYTKDMEMDRAALSHRTYGPADNLLRDQKGRRGRGRGNTRSS